MLRVERFFVENSYQNYNHFICSSVTKKIVVIDPFDVDDILERLRKFKYELVAILLTHAHADHYRGAKDISEELSVPIYAHIDNYEQVPLMHVGLRGNEIISLSDDINLKVIDTPGHIKGHVCFYSKPGKFLICGDTIFNAGVGNVKAKSANIEELFNSVNIISQLPLDTKIYPAHDYFQTNLEFMLSVSNIEYIKFFLDKVRKQTPNTRYVSSIRDELKYNLFFSTNNEYVVKQLKEKSNLSHLNKGLASFKVLRELRDLW